MVSTRIGYEMPKDTLACRGVASVFNVNKVASTGEKTTRICMITGSYFPEVSGGGLQARTLIMFLKRMAGWVVITTTTNRTLPRVGVEDGILIYRIYVRPRNPISKFLATVRMMRCLITLRDRIDVIQLNGFSQKNMIVLVLGKILHKPIVQKITSLGVDDPVALKSTFTGQLKLLFYAKTDKLIAPSPGILESLHSDMVLKHKAMLIPNGVDLVRFRPARSPSERKAIREKLGLPCLDTKIVVFVGFFSRDKDPLTLWRAWRKIHSEWKSKLLLLFIGARQTTYYEIDHRLVAQLHDEIQNAACSESVLFVESAMMVEEYLRVADVFALTSRREGLPNALLEAMATGLPCIATRISGVTDWVIDNGRDGFLIEPGDAVGLAHALNSLLFDQVVAKKIGEAARGTIEERFDMRKTAESYFRMYSGLSRVSRPGSAVRDFS